MLLFSLSTKGKQLLHLLRFKCSFADQVSEKTEEERRKLCAFVFCIDFTLKGTRLFQLSFCFYFYFYFYDASDGWKNEKILGFQPHFVCQILKVVELFGVQQLSLSSFVVVHMHRNIQNLQYTVFFWQFSASNKHNEFCLFICLSYQVRRDLRLLQSCKLEEIVGSCFHVITGRKPRQKVYLLERYNVLLFQIFSCSFQIH